jgi:hypothetical protein
MASMFDAQCMTCRVKCLVLTKVDTDYVDDIVSTHIRQNPPPED